MVTLTVDGIKVGPSLVDLYGHVVTTLKRGRGCRCKVPCQGRFTCMSSHHRGSRSTPYCCGCVDEEESVTGVKVCDDCWCKRERNRERVAKRRAA
jgi:hypothetical protein